MRGFMELMNSGQGVATYWDAIYLEILRSRDLFDTQALLQPDNCPSTIVLVTARRHIQHQLTPARCTRRHPELLLAS